MLNSVRIQFFRTFNIPILFYYIIICYNIQQEIFILLAHVDLVYDVFY